MVARDWDDGQELAVIRLQSDVAHLAFGKKKLSSLGASFGCIEFNGLVSVRAA
jgi:hypothetical protein